MQPTNLVLVWVEAFVRLLGIFFGTWVCHVVFEYAHELFDRRSKGNNGRGRARSQSVRQPSTNISLIITLTVLCLICFTLAQIGGLAVDISIIVCDFYNNHSIDWYFREDDTVDFFAWWATLFAVIAFLMISINAFERLHSTFEHTQYKVPNQYLMFGRVYFLCLFMVGVIVFYAKEQPKHLPFRILLATVSVMYALFNAWLIYSFHTKTMAVVKGMVISTAGSSVSESEQIEDTPISDESLDTQKSITHRTSLKTDEKGLALAHTALRMTICTGLPLITSLCIALITAVNPYGSWQLVVAVINSIDFGLNSFCVMCTFKQAKDKYYEPVLGWMHHWLFELLFQ